MSDDIWIRAEIESPCIKLCTVHPVERICLGCYRSIDEITHWSKLPADTRRQIMADLPGRAPALQQRRGGRAARLARRDAAE